ncbi:molybdopterin converting factor subunit 1 [Mucilaginibacter sp. RS28]|uniref:Molybdopterin synthase sulfur carrier subunit n=1 Tax=Mucilaginibacter straminoryzae TaxID=2932774 RepID=A0A9X1X2Z8_9SPHI|nr:molybdopterin converting factor subunit 1 [Mucilaginibacter straminoryzae]MCJ8210053.1 molybdopterin converting factor subunit 1 [Mucilaginibacter straminoryzae]
MEILLFGITRDITGQQRLNVPADQNIVTVKGLKQWLVEQYPAIGKLSSLAVAVNNTYAEDEDNLTPESEIALIPPVSGG